MRKSSKPARTARRVRIATAAVAGHKTAEIAAAEGLTRAWTARELASSECRQILASLVDARLDRLAVLFDGALKSIGDALKADRVAMYLGGAVKLGADHYARLTACKRLLELLTAGRPTPHTPDTKEGTQQFTLAELERIVKENKAVVQ